jgi:hypothetical protein
MWQVTSTWSQCYVWAVTVHNAPMFHFRCWSTHVSLVLLTLHLLAGVWAPCWLIIADGVGERSRCTAQLKLRRHGLQNQGCDEQVLRRTVLQAFLNGWNWMNPSGTLAGFSKGYWRRQFLHSNGDSCLRRCYNNVFIAGGLDLVYIFDVVRNMRNVRFVLPSVRNEIRLYYPTSTGTS